jgi:hypothetical protein
MKGILVKVVYAVAVIEHHGQRLVFLSLDDAPSGKREGLRAGRDSQVVTS